MAYSKAREHMLRQAGVMAAAIGNGQLYPGTLLRSAQVSRDYQLNRASAQEAIRLLVRWGFAVARPGRAAVVRSVGLDELEREFDACVAAERLAVDHLIARSEPPLLVTPRQSDVAGCLAGDYCFRLALVGQASEVMVEAYRRHAAGVRLGLMRLGRSLSHATTQADARALINAVGQRDLDQAVEAITLHYAMLTLLARDQLDRLHTGDYIIELR